MDTWHQDLGTIREVAGEILAEWGGECTEDEYHGAIRERLSRTEPIEPAGRAKEEPGIVWNTYLIEVRSRYTVTKKVMNQCISRGTAARRAVVLVNFSPSAGVQLFARRREEM